MTQDAATVAAISKAAVGSIVLVMNADKTGFVGQIKESFAAASGLQPVESGPAQPLIAAAVKELGNSKSEAGQQLRAVATMPPPEQLKEATRLVSDARPVLAALPADQAMQVTDWIVSTTESIAKAVKEKGGVDHVSDAEREAIDKLHGMLSTR